MRTIIYILMALYLSGCANKGTSLDRSSMGSEAADSAVQRVYSDAARPPMTVQVAR